MAQDPYKYFRIEARELTEQLARNALDLEKSGQPAGIVARLLRLAHTFKGAARVVKQREIADAAHTIEDVLSPHRDSTTNVPRGSVDALLELIDRISALTAALAPAVDQTAAIPKQEEPASEETFRTMRADMADMDGVVDGLAEVHWQLAGVRQVAQSLDRVRQVTILLSEQIAAPRGRAGLQANAGVTLALIAPMAEELQELTGGLERTLTGGVEQIDREIRQTRDIAERLRLLPVGTVFDSLERTARDSARALGKPVAFETSGKDVALDGVPETAARLGGNVRVEPEAGRGTMVELTVPVSLSSLDALIVEAAGVRAALPLDRVRRTLRNAPEEVARTPAGESILYENKAIPFVDLGHYLAQGERDLSIARMRSAVVMQIDGTLTAVGVDRLLGIENVVLRTLPGLAPADPIVAGASLDAEGNPQIVLDAEGLAARARHGKAGKREQPVRRLPILIIDDSPTTRMLEQSILEAAGYETDVATSAEDALQKVRGRTYGLFLVDVEMPGMDGFTFVERTRADPELRKIPAILVTSRNSPEDLRRGTDVGAYGYIVKEEFDQMVLLDRIRKAMG